MVIGLISLLGFVRLILFHQAGFLISSVALIGASTGGIISIVYMIISSK